MSLSIFFCTLKSLIMKKVFFFLILNFVTFFAIGQKSTKEIYLQLSQIEYQVDSLSSLLQGDESHEVLLQASLSVLEIPSKMQKVHEHIFVFEGFLQNILAKKYDELQDKLITLLKKLNSYLE